MPAAVTDAEGRVIYFNYITIAGDPYLHLGSIYGLPVDGTGNYPTLLTIDYDTNGNLWHVHHA
ncbi:MAG: hypothetical protein ACRETG_05890, partial [Steroidobacteraceae bacterium]